MRFPLLLVCKRALGWSTYSLLLSRIVLGSSPEVDLLVTDIGLANLLVDSQTLQVTGSVTLQIENLGIEPINAPFQVVLFEDTNLDRAFNPSQDNLLGTHESTISIQAGEMITIDVTVIDTVAFAGNLIYAMVDPDNRISELDETNNLAHTGLACRRHPTPGDFQAQLEWSWTSADQVPASSQIISTPIVVRLSDDNGDGQVNNADVPSIVFVTTDDRSSEAGFRPGILRAIRGDSGATLFSVVDPTLRLQAGAQLAAADLDADSLIEIIAVAQGGTRLIAFENNGQFKWFSDSVSVDLGGPAIADLNHDGVPEIIVGNIILDNSGRHKAIGTTSSTGRNGVTGPLSLVANIDLEGDDEIVTGNTVYRSDGSVLWTNAGVQDGFPAVGNLDDDPFPEIVAIRFGYLHALEHTGELIWGPIFIPGGGIGGAPSLADLDGDGQAEIGVAGARNYTVFESNGEVKWSISTQDLSSSMTSSAFFDFEGDGAMEVVYNDELYLRVLDGQDGTVKFQSPNTSGTLLEYPIVADVDNDGAAEIVAVRNQILNFGKLVGLSDQGVFVFGASNGQWIHTRSIWNQHNYHVTNVRVNGQIPPVETPHWSHLNLFRANLATSSLPPEPLPDLRPSFLRFRSSDSTLTVRVGNGGALPAPSGIFVTFARGDSSETHQVLAMTTTSLELAPGRFEDVMVKIEDIPAGEQVINVAVDEDSSGVQRLVECNEENNLYSTRIAFPIRLAVRIIEPASGASFCRDSITVTGQVTTDLPLQQVLCTVNEEIVELADGQFSATVVLSPGENLIRARCVALDSMVAEDSVAVFYSRSPIAAAGGPYRGVVGDSVHFDGSESVDPDGDSLQFVWEFGDGQMAFTEQPAHVYARPGTYLVRLRVEDSHGCLSSDSTQAEIQPAPDPFFATIISPADSFETFCRDSVLVEVALSIVDTTLDLQQIECQVNGTAAELVDSTFSATIPLQRNRNTIVALCLGPNGFVVADSIVVFSLKENQPPTCTLNMRPGIAKGVFEDEGSGIAEITVTKMRNGRLVVEPFTPGAKQVSFRVEAIDLNSHFGFSLLATDLCGNYVICDPVLVTLSGATDPRVKVITFDDIDRYLTIQNYGLERIDLVLNGAEFHIGVAFQPEGDYFPIASQGSIVLDLQKHIRPGENEVEVEFYGPPESYALLQLADQATHVDYILDLIVLPQRFALYQNYPNPFNPSTKIVFDIPAQEKGGVHTRLRIFNSVGELVRMLFEGVRAPGKYEYTWDGLDGHGQLVSSGMYFYQLEVGKWSQTRRMLLIQ